MFGVSAPLSPRLPASSALTVRDEETITFSSCCAATDGGLKRGDDELLLTREHKPAAVTLLRYHGKPVSAQRFLHHLQTDPHPINAERCAAPYRSDASKSVKQKSPPVMFGR